jgi:CheY-like chemotaxis protein
MTDLLRRTLGEGIEVRTEIRDLLYRTMIDPNQLENAILNLGINARDAMPKGGALTIEVANVDVDADYALQHVEMRQGRYVAITVTDNGTGMSPEVRERAFEPFFTTKPVGAGTGLGLSMVYGFVRQSGGYIQLYSDIGRGTTIRMYLPRAGEDEAAGGEAEESPIRSYPAKGETVLVAEDDERVRRVTLSRLEALGYRVLEAENGPAALKILTEQEDRIDLLFTDMVMPGGLSGDELAAQARRRLPNLKILFTTGYVQPDAMRRGLAESANWLNKPYTALALAQKLREVLDG